MLDDVETAEYSSLNIDKEGKVIIMKKIIYILVFVLLAFTVIAQDEALTIDAEGNVGINNSVPEATLDVNGEILTDNLVVTENLSAQEITSSSINGQLLSSQLDYIYAGTQNIYTNRDYSMSSGQTIDLAKAYGGQLLGSPVIPNPDPENYTLCFYLSATGGNNNGNYPKVCLNNVELITIASWASSNWHVTRSSLFFKSWQQFPSVDIMNGNYGLVLQAKAVNGATTLYLRNVTVHYVYIRNSVDYPRVFSD